LPWIQVGGIVTRVANSDLNLLSQAVVAAAVVVARDLLPRGAQWLFHAYRSRAVDPKRAHCEFLAEQNQWLQERVSKLAVFRLELDREPRIDNLKLTLLISRLDPKDREWAMKEPDIDILKRCAEAKAAECRENIGENSRLAEEIANRTFLFPL